MLSKTFIDYHKANYEDLKENFTLSNQDSNDGKKKPIQKKKISQMKVLFQHPIIQLYQKMMIIYDRE